VDSQGTLLEREPPEGAASRGCILQIGRFPLEDGFVVRATRDRTITEADIVQGYGQPIERRDYFAD
jgi:hypothetical protein